MALLKKINVLIAEDEISLLRLLKLKCERMGAHVITCNNGKEAIEILEDNEIDLIISDIRMPELDGIEILKFSRDKFWDKPAVILLSGYADYTLMDIYNMGADVVLGKPYRMQDVVEYAKKILLERDDRWKECPDVEISKKVSLSERNLDESIENKKILIGRGGLYIFSESIRCQVTEYLEFEITFENGNILNISGIGRVMWLEKFEEKRKIGLQIEYLESSCRKKIIDYIEDNKFKEYIPYEKK